MTDLVERLRAANQLLEADDYRYQDNPTNILKTLADAITALTESREALKWAVRQIDKETCQHENISRGGIIWTICDDCGKKWADDEGGFVPYQENPMLTKCRELIKSTPTEAQRVEEKPYVGCPSGKFWLPMSTAPKQGQILAWSSDTRSIALVEWNGQEFEHSHSGWAPSDLEFWHPIPDAPDRARWTEQPKEAVEKDHPYLPNWVHDTLPHSSSPVSRGVLETFAQEIQWWVDRRLSSVKED